MLLLHEVWALAVPVDPFRELRMPDVQWSRSGHDAWAAEARFTHAEDNADHAEDRSDWHTHPEFVHLRDTISRKEAVVASLQGKISAIMSELTSVMSLSLIEQLVAWQGANEADIAALLSQEGGLLASLPTSSPAAMIMNLRARRGELSQVMLQLDQLRAQIAQVQTRIALVMSSGRSRVALG